MLEKEISDNVKNKQVFFTPIFYRVAATVILLAMISALTFGTQSKPKKTRSLLPCEKKWKQHAP